MSEGLIVDVRVKIGRDVFLGNFIHIRPDVEIGDNSEIRDFCFIARGAKIGKKTRIFQYCNICAGAIIGDEVFMAPGVILANDREQSYPYGMETWNPEPPVVEDKVRIGVGAIILPRVRLGEGSHIGAGAVVTRDTEPWKTYIGNPARVLNEADIRCLVNSD